MTFLYVYIGLHFCILLWLLVNRRYMPSLQLNPNVVSKPKVSILIPLRDEAHQVESLIQNLAKLSYSNLEIIFLNDQSTDATKSELTKNIHYLNQAKIIDGKELPPGWGGKNYACEQLSKQASGAYYLFLDADVRLHSHAVEASLEQLQQRSASLLSGFPAFPVKGFLAPLVVPMQHVFIYLHLPLLLCNNSRMPQAAAAHGCFMLFEAKAYQFIGGHQAVKASLVEDVHLARLMKQKGYAICLANITHYVTCSMYQTTKEVWHGFSKNAFPGIGKSWLVASFVILFYSFVFILPVCLLWFAFAEHWLYAFPLLLSILTKWLIDRMARQKAWIALFIPFSAIATLAILIRSISLSVTKTGYTWKGRTYS